MKEENFNMDYVFGKEHRKAYMGLAMLWIIGYHFYLVQSEFIDHYLFPFKLLFRNGFVGVDIFFILSAYGLCCSWENSTVKSFYKKRFIRIIPLYVGFLILCKLILKTNHMVTDGMLQITSLSIFDTPYTKTKEMSGEWFVPAIINLYLIFPFLFNFVKCIDKRFPIFGVYAFSTPYSQSLSELLHLRVLLVFQEYIAMLHQRQELRQGVRCLYKNPCDSWHVTPCWELCYLLISLPSFHLQRYKNNPKYASKIMFIFLIFNSFYERQMRSDN